LLGIINFMQLKHLFSTLLTLFIPYVDKNTTDCLSDKHQIITKIYIISGLPHTQDSSG